MKIFETKLAPNPRRVRIFLAEKGIDCEFVELNIKAGDNMTADMLAKNPGRGLPFLELDDGTVISESVAICRYFEVLYPEPALMGKTAEEQGVIEMMQRRIEFEFFLPVAMGFQHTTGYFSDRMTPIEAWGKESVKNAEKKLHQLDQMLSEKPFVAGNSFSIADITLLCAIDFARVIKIRPQAEHKHLLAWHERISARPSASA